MSLHSHNLHWLLYPIHNRVLAFSVLICLSHLSLHAQTRSMDLHEGWTFHESGELKEYPASVPGNVFMDLYANGLIPHPFYGSNEDSVQWVEEKDWTYTLHFPLDSSWLNLPYLYLVFDGLDTYADVYLNDTLLLRSRNMHVGHTLDVKPYLTGLNSLRVRFHPVMDTARALAKANDINLPVDERIYVRKAQYQFGWDWGPRFVGCGIWQPVRLEGHEGARLLQGHVKLDSMVDNRAFMRANISYEAHLPKGALTGIYSFEWYVNDTLLTRTNNLLSAGSTTEPVPLFAGIHKPKLWWPVGNGDPYLYSSTVYLIHKDKRIDSLSLPFGIRTVELDTTADSTGRRFQFLINDKPVYANGANFIPTHSFPSQTTEDDYRRQLQDIADAGVNMLRIWGGGIYEKELFYSLCDSLGIMVWQDFMFACAMYPGDDDFMGNVADELLYQINRLKGHPSIVLWCGNNEVDEAWHNWGWKLKYGKQKEESIWADYEKLFHEKIPKTLALYDDTRPYWPSSPSIGWGREESLLSGDMHYWGVWWGKEPFSIWKDKTGRFMSEYGFQGFPSLFTLKKYIENRDLFMYSPAMKTHQKHPVGYETIAEYMERDFPVPARIEDYAYVSQLLQAWGMQQAFDAHIQAAPYCMGTLFWQWNDCWPVTSWSAVDFEGARKALYYAAKRSFGDRHVSLRWEGDSLHVYYTTFQLLGYEEGAIWLIRPDGSVQPAQTVRGSGPLGDLPQSALVASFSGEDLEGYTMLTYERRLAIPGGTLFSSTRFLRSPNESMLQPATVTSAYDSTLQALILDTDLPVWGVYLYTDNGELRLSDNYFPMRPGEQKVVYLEEVPDNFDGVIRIRTLNELIKKD